MKITWTLGNFLRTTKKKNNKHKSSSLLWDRVLSNSQTFFCRADDYDKIWWNSHTRIFKRKLIKKYFFFFRIIKVTWKIGNILNLPSRYFYCFIFFINHIFLDCLIYFFLFIFVIATFPFKSIHDWLLYMLKHCNKTKYKIILIM